MKKLSLSARQPLTAIQSNSQIPKLIKATPLLTDVQANATPAFPRSTPASGLSNTSFRRVPLLQQKAKPALAVQSSAKTFVPSIVEKSSEGIGVAHLSVGSTTKVLGSVAKCGVPLLQQKAKPTLAIQSPAKTFVPSTVEKSSEGIGVAHLSVGHRINKF